MTPLERVTERVMRMGNPEQRSVPIPLLTLEEFFDGNDSVGSIGCNLDAEPEPQAFFSLLNDIRSRPDVSDVRIQITCVDAPGEEWPFSDTIWIMTDSDADTVESWFPEQLRPDSVSPGWGRGLKYEECPVQQGHDAIGVCYD